MKRQSDHLASELREPLSSLRRRIASGEESSLFVWAIPDQLACCQRPLRDHPEFGGRGRPLPPEATAPLLKWIERIRASGILSIITLMHPKELKYYETIGAHPDGLLGLYRSAGFTVAHIPWADPAHERTATARAEVMRHIENVKTQALAAFRRLPKPVLLHCSAAIDLRQLLHTSSGQAAPGASEAVGNYKDLMWEHHHYRFGVAGEGQADIIEKILKAQPGSVLNVGCGSDLGKIETMAAVCVSLIAADREFSLPKTASRQTRTFVRFIITDARHLALADRSVDHIIALGLFAWIPQDETAQVMAEFARVYRGTGGVMITNSLARPKGHYRRCAIDAGFRIVEESEGYCPAASGDVKRRYLLVLKR